MALFGAKNSELRMIYSTSISYNKFENCQWHNTVYIRKVMETAAKAFKKGRYHRASLWILSDLKIKHILLYMNIYQLCDYRKTIEYSMNDLRFIRCRQ